MQNNPFIECPDCVESRAKLKAILADFLPEERQHRNTVLAAFEEGIVDEIRKAQKLDNFLVSRFVKILVNDYGIAESSARWAVDYWMSAYGVDVLGKILAVSDPVPARNEASKDTPSSPAPIVAPPAADVVNLMEIDDNELFPPSIVVFDQAAGSKYGITSASFEVYLEFAELMKVAGTISGTTKKSFELFVMVYNARGQLIGWQGSDFIEKGSRGKQDIEVIVSVPDDEFVSKVLIRPVPYQYDD